MPNCAETLCTVIKLTKIKKHQRAQKRIFSEKVRCCTYIIHCCQIIAFRARKEIAAENLHNYSLMFWQCPRISLIQGISFFYVQNILLLLNISLLENILKLIVSTTNISLFSLMKTISVLCLLLTDRKYNSIVQRKLSL